MAQDAPAAKPNNGEALKAQDAIQTSQDAIAQQASQLSSTLEPILAAAEASAQQARESSPAEAGQAAPSPEQQARGEQLARVLDELDRQQQAADGLASTEQPVSSDQPNQAASPPATLAQAVRSQQEAMNAARLQAQQEAALTHNENATDSLGPPPTTGPNTDFTVAAVNRSEDAEWGKLRNKSAEDLSKGSSEAVAEDYRKSVSTYFRVLAERARRKK